MRGLGVIERGYIVSERGRIAAIGAGDAPPLAGTRRDMRGRVVMPAFVDCHTHALHAGERYGETAKRLAGVPYLEILAAGPRCRDRGCSRHRNRWRGWFRCG